MEQNNHGSSVDLFFLEIMLKHRLTSLVDINGKPNTVLMPGLDGSSSNPVGTNFANFGLFFNTQALGYFRLVLTRVTIFLKAKIGTTEGQFARGQNFGLFNYFYNKIGTLKLTCRLVSAGNRRGFKKKGNRGDLQKKKVNTFFSAHFVSLLGPKLHKSCIHTGFDLFFFFRRSPQKSSFPA